MTTGVIFIFSSGLKQMKDEVAVYASWALVHISPRLQPPKGLMFSLFLSSVSDFSYFLGFDHLKFIFFRAIRP